MTEQSNIRTALFEGRYEQAFAACRDARERQGERTPEWVLYAGACALFGLGHIHQSEEWVEAHGRATMYRADHLYLAAYLELHRRRYENALLLWTRIVQADPGETFADGLIAKLKKGDHVIERELEEHRAFLRYVPLEPVEGVAGARPDKSTKSTRKKSRGDAGAQRDIFRPVVFGIVLLAGLSIGGALAVEPIANFFRPDPYKSLLEDLPQPPSSGTVVSPAQFGDEDPRFTYADRDAALVDYRSARERIGEGKINQARYLLGKLEFSNAGFEIKERALLLRDSIPRVPRADFRDPVDMASILGEPLLYRGATVFWRGSVKDLRRAEGGLRFRLNTGSEASVDVLYLFPREGPGSFAQDLSEDATVAVYGEFTVGVESGDGRLLVQARELLPAVD